MVSYLPRRSDHNHHLLQVELVSGEVLNGHVILDLTARLPRVVEHFPKVGDPGLQQDELRGEPLQQHGEQAVCKVQRTQMLLEDLQRMENHNLDMRSERHACGKGLSVNNRTS